MEDGQADPLAVLSSWKVWASPAQTPPEGEWRVWMMMGGRGAGKTRAGAEWVRSLVERGEARRIALVGPTLHDVREVMVGGPSGLIAVAPEGEAPVYEPSRRRLAWGNGAEAFAFSAEDPDSLRGPQFDAAWCDEIGAWTQDVKTWDTLMFALRLGRCPRIAVTTTPRARELVMKLAEAATELPPPSGEGRPPGAFRIVITRAATRENARNLAPGFLAAMEEAYGGTRTGRQELEGELVRDAPGALFTRGMIDKARMTPEEAPRPFERIVVGVDPPAGAGAGSGCGIVVAGLLRGAAYVLCDASVHGARPLEWSERAVATARTWGADMIVAECNQGGEMVRDMLAMAGAREVCVVQLRHAKEGKLDRAGPVSGLYEKGMVRHVGVFRELEAELFAFGAEGARRDSPDRVDALVWAVRELTDRRAKPGMFWL